MIMVQIGSVRFTIEIDCDPALIETMVGFKVMQEAIPDHFKEALMNGTEKFRELLGQSEVTLSLPVPSQNDGL